MADHPVTKVYHGTPHVGLAVVRRAEEPSTGGGYPHCVVPLVCYDGAEVEAEVVVTQRGSPAPGDVGVLRQGSFLPGASWTLTVYP